MPMDAICISALVSELSPIIGGRIDKIYQPVRDEIVLSLRSAGGTARLLLSANPTRPRAQFIAAQRENPAEPPMFCMLLRKYLTGGRIVSIVQPPMERLIAFHIEATDELGDRTEKQLILEAMGRYSNLILLDADGRIIDCLRRVDAEMSEQRQILPGMFYRLPPTQGKLNPLTLSQEEKADLSEHISDQPADRWLVQTFGGISPLIARELVFETTAATDTPIRDCFDPLLATLESVCKDRMPVAHILERDGKPADFSFREILQYGTKSQKFETFSEMLDAFYAARETYERVRQMGQDLIRSVTTARDRLVRKLGVQKKEFSDTQDREQFRQQGDLITANLYQMQKGMRSLRTVNFYDPNEQEIEIRLDPLRTPQQNAARYYKDYNRAKTAEKILTEQIEKGEQELSYLNSVLESISRADGARDLQEIRQEMIEGGYSKRSSKSKNHRPAAKPLEFRSSSGFRISVGRNNTQNDLLTLKLAGRNDIWFHTQKIHGAHVILWTDKPQAVDLTEAAMLAAWFSQGRNGVNVPVDYTPLRYVKKPAGARPGMVIYSTYKTTYVSPDETLLQKLTPTPSL
ncbi:MAG: NFACT RNA binding domain-containing protein [Evtepia sp.]